MAIKLKKQIKTTRGEQTIRLAPQFQERPSPFYSALGFITLIILFVSSMALSLSNNFSLCNPPKTLLHKKPTSSLHFNPTAISFSVNKSSSPFLFLSNTKTPFSFYTSFSVKASNFSSQVLSFLHLYLHVCIFY